MTKSTTLFPVEMTLHENGCVELKDIQGQKWSICNKNGSVITKNEYDKIVDADWGFWELAKRFILTANTSEVV